MRLIALCGILALATLAAAQNTCPCPQADLFSALEPDTHEGPGKIFRGIMPAMAGGQCGPDATITSRVVTVPEPGASFETVVAPGLGGLVFAIKLKTLFADVTGAEDGTCFKLDVANFVHPPNPIIITDGCGSRTMTVGQPKYACILGPPVGKTMVCFAAKVVGPAGPLPAGFDRFEDVCALVDIL